MTEFEIKLNEFFEELGIAKKMVLATSKNDRVTARMMSCILLDGLIYFQTDKKFLKYEQMQSNPSVALCVDNTQIEGTATIWGHPLEQQYQFFAAAFKKHYFSSFSAYSSLPDEILISVKPTRITLWDYENGKPFRISFNTASQEYIKEFYAG